MIKYFQRWRQQRYINKLSRACREADSRLKGLGMRRAERRRFFREIVRGLNAQIPKGEA